jgi:hypothetical protein
MFDGVVGVEMAMTNDEEFSSSRTRCVALMCVVASLAEGRKTTG